MEFYERPDPLAPTDPDGLFSWLMTNFVLASVHGRPVVGGRQEIRVRKPVGAWDVVPYVSSSTDKETASVSEWWGLYGRA